MDIFTFISNHILLVMLALVSGGMLLWPLLRPGAGSSSVSTLQATQMINRQDALMLDVRDEAAYAEGHIINARNIPLDQLEARVTDLGKHKNKPVIAYCDGGTRSAGAVAALGKLGIEKAFSLAGGFTAWKQAGLPTAK